MKLEFGKIYYFSYGIALEKPESIGIYEGRINEKIMITDLANTELELNPFQPTAYGTDQNRLKFLKEIPVVDLPLYISWPFKSDLFVKLLKGGCQ